MADTYTTEAIACGLRDVAGWLENEGGPEKHARTIRLGVERLRELGAAAHPGEADRVGLEELAARFEAKSQKCLQQMRDACDAGEPGEDYFQGGAVAFAEARDMARAGAASAVPALGTGEGSGGATKAALDELKQAAIAFAKADRIRADAVEVYNTAWLAADTDDYKVARKLTATESASLNAAVEVIARAQIRLHKAATATLRASQEQDGEVRDV